jgi:hypothetical protein
LPPPPQPANTLSSSKSELSLTPQERKLLVDLSSFEFTDSSDLIKTFEKFEINFDHILSSNNAQQNNKKLRSNSSVRTPVQKSKYVETLLNWKSREEENPHVIIPQDVVVINKRPPTSPQPSDWVKAINSGMFSAEPNKKKLGSQQSFSNKTRSKKSRIAH